LKANVIGFSIAGSLMASELADRGHGVKAYEEHKNASDSIECSGLISNRGMDGLSKRISLKSAIRNRINGAKIFIGSEWIDIRKGSSVAYVVDREKVNEISAKAAGKRGVEVEYGKRKAANEIAKMRNVIGADGPWSETAVAFGFPPIRKYAYTMHAYVDNVWEKDMVRIFINDAFRGFFGWIIPRRSMSEIGFGTTDRAGLGRGLKFFEDCGTGVKWRGAVIPISMREKIQDRNAMLFGDAAGLTKSATGGGITFMSIALPWFADAFEGKCEIDKRIRESRLMREIRAHDAIQSANEIVPFHAKKAMLYGLELAGIANWIKLRGDMDFPTSMLGGIENALE
jgi:flavin-dependent dehydrogenase